MSDDGRGEQIRTADPWPPMPVRYQAAPRPDVCLFNPVRECPVLLSTRTARKRARDVETLGVLRLTVSRASRRCILHTPESVVKRGNRRTRGFFAHAPGLLLQVGRAHDMVTIKDHRRGGVSSLVISSRSSLDHHNWVPSEG
jgi:hypothetical protein